MKTTSVASLESFRAIFKEIIPKLNYSRYKGQNGKIGVIGGCFEYTGAPYYSALCALRSGADLSHIFCTQDASIPIKSYSPEIIVHPTLGSSFEKGEIPSLEQIIDNTTKWYPNLHVVVIGPGLGRDPLIESFISKLLEKTEEKLVIADADFFHFIIQKAISEEVLKKKSRSLILTPNKAEFSRMFEHFFGKESKQVPADEIQKEIEKLKLNGPLQEISLDNPIAMDVVILSKRLFNTVIYKKGEVDVITDGFQAFIISEPSSLKRCGGQGDLLVGMMSVFTYWSLNSEFSLKDNKIILGALMAGIVIRKASKKAYDRKRISLVVPDIFEHIYEALCETVGDSKL